MIAYMASYDMPYMPKEHPRRGAIALLTPDPQRHYVQRSQKICSACSSDHKLKWVDTRQRTYLKYGLDF